MNLNVIGELCVDKFIVFFDSFSPSAPSTQLFVLVGIFFTFYLFLAFLLLGKCVDLADRKMMNRRFFTSYDDFIHSFYDEYYPPHHSSSSGAHNDIYGRMYSDHGELKIAN